MVPGIKFIDGPSEEETQAVLQPLLDNNLQRGPLPCLQRFAFMLTGDAGFVGGLIGRTAYDWAVIELLYVPTDVRGTGAGQSLVARAEELARDRGCVGIWLDSFGFQAPGFYQKLGYEVFGELPENPRGQSRFFLRKLLT